MEVVLHSSLLPWVNSVFTDRSSNHIANATVEPRRVHLTVENTCKSEISPGADALEPVDCQSNPGGAAGN